MRINSFTKLFFGLTIILNIFSFSTNAQTITNVAADTNFVCLKQGANTLNISFTPTGFASTALFQVILSDENGSFLVIPPNIIGASNVSPITATIPLGTIPSGNYQLTVGELVTQTVGDTSGLINIVAALDSFQVTIDTPQDTICSGSTITFNASLNPVLANASYKWFINNSQVTGQTLSTFTTSSITANSVVRCEVVITGECITDSTATSNSIGIVIGNNVPFQVTASSSETTICQGSNVTLNSNIIEGVGPYTYSWEYTVGLGAPVVFGTTDNITTNAIPAGASIKLFVTSAATCLANNEDSVIVTLTILSIVANPPAISIIQNEAFCDPVNGVAVFTVSPSIPGATYNWIVGTNTLPPQAIPTRLTLNVASVAIGQPISCIMTITAPCLTNNQSTSNVILVEIQNAPNITINDDFEIAFGAETTLEIQGDYFGPSISWSPSSNEYINNPNSANPKITPPRTTKYTLTVLSTQKCLVVEEVIVSVLPNKELFIPTAFSPNGDGQNDILYCRSKENQFEPKTFLMQIFDENGTRVFSSKYQNYGWDGNYKNEPCEQGGYIYHITGAYFNFEPFEFTGKFLLIR